ncbi:YvcK family protein, partial [Patescibacteria group bacterium]|nr:YvcK family protein [Patescibacteria group bacterium]MBU4481779.1 YvcK family protein [Patescibacteria group bacterium]
MKRVRKIVCFGGGNAMPKAVLEVLKNYPVKITSVSSMFDSGGSSGKLRKDFNVLPPGDIRRHILALSEAPNWKKDLWKWRFNSFGDVEVKPQPSQDRHQGHNFGNVFLAGLEYVLKDYRQVLEIADDFMEVKHQVLPVTIDKTQLAAKLENGEVIEGEDEIDVPKKHEPNLKIKKLFLKPQAKIFPETKKAILEADLITLGPGDLYSSIIACFLPEGVKEALRKTKARKIFICPAMTKLGETKDFSVSDFAREVEKYLGFPLDYVIYNTEIPAQKRLKEYKKKEPLFLGLVKIDENLDKKKFIGKNILVKSGPIVYDSKKVAKFILSFI